MVTNESLSDQGLVMRTATQFRQPRHREVSQVVKVFLPISVPGPLGFNQEFFMGIHVKMQIALQNVDETN